jgi:hypothetical protein
LEAPIPFRTANRDLHFMILHRCKRIDFWSSTGKWIARGFREVSGRGIAALLTYRVTQRRRVGTGSQCEARTRTRREVSGAVSQWTESFAIPAIPYG